MGKIEFRVIKNERCVHFIGTGSISYEYLINRIKALHNHPDFDFSFNSFIDFEGATVSFTEDGFDSYKSFFDELQKEKIYRKWAIYTKEELTFLNANMSHLLSSKEIEVDVFQNRDRALEFLGINNKDLFND